MAPSRADGPATHLGAAHRRDRRRAQHARGRSPSTTDTGAGVAGGGQPGVEGLAVVDARPARYGVAVAVHVSSVPTTTSEPSARSSSSCAKRADVRAVDLRAAAEAEAAAEPARARPCAATSTLARCARAR